MGGAKEEWTRDCTGNHTITCVLTDLFETDLRTNKKARVKPWPAGAVVLY